jgi:beta-phosphoglucomutase
MIGSLFFEVEGVLAGTAGLRRTALLRALADEGLSPADVSDIGRDAGQSTRDAVRRAVKGDAIAIDEAALTLIALRADRHFASLVHAGVSLAPGVRELIEQSVSAARLAVVSGLDRATIESLLSLAELDGAFEVIIAAEDVAAVKPAPDGYRKALERMIRRRPLDVRAALAFEPGPIGARAARAAELRCAIIAPFRAESVAEADSMLESLAGETLATLEAMLPIGAAG